MFLFFYFFGVVVIFLSLVWMSIIINFSLLFSLSLSLWLVCSFFFESDRVWSALLILDQLECEPAFYSLRWYIFKYKSKKKQIFYYMLCFMFIYIQYIHLFRYIKPKMLYSIFKQINYYNQKCTRLTKDLRQLNLELSK
jgi:hypothetical protein